MRSATAFAAFMAATALQCPTAYAADSVTGSQIIRLSEFRALRQSSAWSSLREKLRRWKSLPLDWDGDDGVAPSAFTIDASHLIINELESVEAPVPRISVSGDGEVVFEWVRGNGYASISQTGDGHLIAFLREPEGDEPLRIDQPFDPLALTPFLNRIGAFA